MPVILMCYCENNYVLLLFSACGTFYWVFLCAELCRKASVWLSRVSVAKTQSRFLCNRQRWQQRKTTSLTCFTNYSIFFFYIFFDCYLACVHPLIFLWHIKIKDVYLSFSVSRIRLYQWNLKLINKSISWSLTEHSVHSMYV